MAGFETEAKLVPVMNPITISLLGLTVLLSVSCDSKPTTPVAAPAPAPPPPTTSEQAKDNAHKALTDMKSALGHAGDAIKDLSVGAKDKLGDLAAQAKEKLSSITAEDFHKSINGAEQSIREAKAKGGEHWTNLKAKLTPALEKVKSLGDSIPGEKVQAAKQKCQKLLDVLAEKEELPPEAPSEPAKQ